MQNLYHTSIGSSAVLGSSIGSLFGGKLVGYGRRKTVILVNIVCAFAVIPTMILNIYAICAGRLVFGFFAGIYQVAVPRMIEETVPLHLLPIFGTVTNLAVNGGKMLSIVIGGGIPSSSDKEASKHTNYWRFVFAVPWIL